MGSFLHRFLQLSLPPVTPPVAILLSTVCVLVDLWFVLYIAGGSFYFLHVNLEYMHIFKTAIDKLMISKDRLEAQLRIYTKLRVITTIFNSVFGKVYIPLMKTLLGTMIVQSAFITVRLADRTGWFVTVFGVSVAFIVIISLSLFITFTALVHAYSSKFHDYLKRKSAWGSMLRSRSRSNMRTGTEKKSLVLERQWNKVLMNGFRVEAVKSGSFYQIQRETCLTVLGLLGNICGSALISVKL